jgi:hypothetical protein
MGLKIDIQKSPAGTSPNLFSQRESLVTFCTNQVAHTHLAMAIFPESRGGSRTAPTPFQITIGRVRGQAFSCLTCIPCYDFRENTFLSAEKYKVTKESIIDQTYSSKISPDPSFSKRGNSSLL